MRDEEEEEEKNFGKKEVFVSRPKEKNVNKKIHGVVGKRNTLETRVHVEETETTPL